MFFVQCQYQCQPSLKFLLAIRMLPLSIHQTLWHSESVHQALKMLGHLGHLGTWHTWINMTQEDIKCKGVHKHKYFKILMKQQLSIDYLVNYPLLWLVETRLKMCIIFHPLLHQPSASHHLTWNEFHLLQNPFSKPLFRKVLNYWNHCSAYHLHGLNQKYKLMQLWILSHKLARYTEMFETNPKQLKSINLTTLILKSLWFTRVRVSE